MFHFTELGFRSNYHAYCAYCFPSKLQECGTNGVKLSVLYKSVGISVKILRKLCIICPFGRLISTAHAFHGNEEQRRRRWTAVGVFIYRTMPSIGNQQCFTNFLDFRLLDFSVLDLTLETTCSCFPVFFYFLATHSVWLRKALESALERLNLGEWQEKSCVKYSV